MRIEKNKPGKIVRILRLTVRAVVCLMAAVGIYLLAAWILARIPVAGEPPQSSDVTIYLKTNGVHTDIVVPLRHPIMDWSRQIKYEHTKATDSSFTYLAMGWGDKGFYLETPEWSDLKFSVAFRAAFALSTTAIHATFYKQLPEDSACKKVVISARHYQRLVNYIRNSFQTNGNGNFMVIPTDANYGDHDAFYEAKGSYSMLHTCNTWANNALKHSRLPACVWTPFDTGIFLQYP